MSCKQGRLICVGTGMRLAGQMTAIAKSHIEQADVVLGAVANALSRQWLMSVAKEYICLAQFYGDGTDEGKARDITYQQMVECIVEQVRLGKTVCAAFYGHPGIFACIAHKAIAQAKSEGFAAHMEPGISAEDCLVADLGLDPGATGLTSMEATQFLIYQRVLDPATLVILWQPGLVGDLTLKQFKTSRERLSLLVEKLSQYYPLDHQVILYEAATSAVTKGRQEKLTLGSIPDADIQVITTLVIPAYQSLVIDQDYVSRLKAL